MEPTKLAAVRARRRWTLEQAAEHLCVDVNTLHKWEKGKATPRAYNVQKLCEVYELSAWELGIGNQILNDLPERAIIDEVNTLRTNVCSDFVQQDLELQLQCVVYNWLHQKKPAQSYTQLQWRLSQQIGDTMSHDHLGEVHLGRRDALRRLALLPVQALGLSTLGTILAWAPEDILTHCAAGITACEHLSKGTREDITLASWVISAYVPVLKTIVKDSSSHRKEAAKLVAQCQLLKATLSVHKEGPKLAASYAQQAFTYSEESGDIPLQLVILRRLAWIYSCDKQGKHAVSTALQAEHLLKQSSKPISPLVQSTVYTGVATYQAQNGQKDAALLALHNAHKTFFSFSDDDTHHIPVDHDHSTLLMEDGLTHYYTGQYAKALDSFSQAIDLETLTAKTPMSSERIRIEILNYQTLASLKLPKKDMELSIKLWAAGIQGAKALQSEQRLSEALTAYEMMEAVWSSEPRIQELRALTGHW